MDDYFIDRTHKRLIRVDEFQHHGIMGQRWGVITRNVGVNYIPIGRRSATPLLASSFSDKKKRLIDDAIADRLNIYTVNLPDSFKNGIYRHVQNSRIAKNSNSSMIIKMAVDNAVSKAELDFNKGFDKYLKENGLSGFGKKSWKAVQDYENKMYAENSINVTEAFGWKSGDFPKGVQLRALMVNDIPIGFGFTYGGKLYSSKSEAVKAANRQDS